MDRIIELLIEYAKKNIDENIIIWLCIIIFVAYIAFKIGYKQAPNNHIESKVQCDEYTNQMNKRNNIMSYQYLKLTYVNNKPLSLNCPYWNAKNNCELIKNKKCKFFK